ncbi:MAG TPA: putative sulfate exporter family transporter [Polyangiales bacterium]|nr:putative sulfate exporter family transporter [Polyangiales bacterium]
MAAAPWKSRASVGCAVQDACLCPAGHMNEGAIRQGIGEDWLALILGVSIFAVALVGLAGVDVLGWVVTTRVWTDLGAALAPVSKSYAAWSGGAALVATYLALLAVLALGARLLGRDLKPFVLAFTVVFWLSYACWILGSYAHLAATTPAELAKHGIAWSLRLTNEGGYILALLLGLAVGNFLPRLAERLRPAIQPELYVKTAVVILGASLAISAADKLDLAASVLWRGFAAIIEAYLIYWAVVYFVARRWFGFSREWAAPLASGISICGVSAAIATGSAIRARPVVPVVVSSLVVIFAVVELLILPLLAGTFLSHEPMVAGAWLGLSVKTDGAALASGSIAESLILARAAEQGIHYQPGWIVGATTTVKVFIDVFIGVWAFVLAVIWTNYIDVRPGERARPREIWQRFPKFVLGYVLTFALTLALALHANAAWKTQLKALVGEANVLRGIFSCSPFRSVQRPIFGGSDRRASASSSPCTACACSGSSSGWASVFRGCFSAVSRRH